MADFDLALQRRPNFPAPYQQSRPDLPAPRRTAARLRRIQHRAIAQQRQQPLCQPAQSRAGADPAQAIRIRRSPISPKASRSIRKHGRSRTTAASPMPRWAAWTRRWPIATRCSRSIRSFPGRWPAAATSIVVKGDLDAALKDYNDALKLSPNFVSAYVGRGQVYEARKDMVAARYDYRSAGAALTKVDDYETTLARRFAKERLAVAGCCRSVAAQPVDGAGGAARRKIDGPAFSALPASMTRKVALIVGNGAYRNVPKLANPPRDAKLIADTLRESRLPDRDAGARSRPRPVLHRAARLRP